MKQKVMAIFLAVVVSCQPSVMYASELSDFSDSEESIMQDENLSENATENEDSQEAEAFVTNQDDTDLKNENFNDGIGEDIEESEFSEENKRITGINDTPEFSDKEDIWSDGSVQSLNSLEKQSDAPGYDAWLSDTVISGLKMNGTTYGNSMYELFKQMQEPVYAELGGMILDDIPMMSISSVWDGVINKNFYNNQKLIYETLLMEYIKYENTSNAAGFDTSQIDRANSHLIKIFNELSSKYLDEGVQNWSPSEFMNMSVEDAVKSFENLENMKETIELVQNVSENTKELLTLAADISALNDAKQQKIELIKSARNACVNMKSPNNDFISACDEIIGQMESAVIDIGYMRTQGAAAGMSKLIDKVWKGLTEENVELKIIDFGADAMDILFNTSDAAANNLKLSILYTMDCYLKMGLSDVASRYLNQKTDENLAQTFNSCFEGYINFQIYGNSIAKAWIGSVIDGGALNRIITYIIYRENLKTASELTALCNSQNKTRSQILNIIEKYQDIYSNLYMKDEYKQAISAPITPTPVVNPEDYKISEGITSARQVKRKGKYSGKWNEAPAYWTLFEDGTMVFYGAEKIPVRGYYGSGFGFPTDEIKKLIILDGVRAIESGVFQNLECLEEVELPKSLRFIGDFSFYGCNHLKKVNLENVSGIRPQAFSSCALENIVISGEVDTIGYQAFEYCSNLRKVKISDGVKKIGEKAFRGCENLTEIDLPSSIITIYNYAFDNTGLRVVKTHGDLGMNLWAENYWKYNFSAFGFEDNPNLIIYGKTGSEVEKYASAHKIEFRDITGKNPTSASISGQRPVIGKIQVQGNKAEVFLTGTMKNVGRYDFVLCSDKKDLASKKYLDIRKNMSKPETSFSYLQAGTYYAYCRGWNKVNGKKVFTKWSKPFKFTVKARTVAAPKIENVKISGHKIVVKLSKDKNAIGCYVVLGTKLGKDQYGKKPVSYGKQIKKDQTGTTITFTNVPSGTYYVGAYAYNHSGEGNKKVFSKWSDIKKISVK